jgi:hypothetical protein
VGEKGRKGEAEERDKSREFIATAERNETKTPSSLFEINTVTETAAGVLNLQVHPCAAPFLEGNGGDLHVPGKVSARKRKLWLKMALVSPVPICRTLVSFPAAYKRKRNCFVPRFEIFEVERGLSAKEVN